MKLDRISVHDRVLIVGKSGSGKSYCGKELVRRELEHWRVLVVDPMDEWSQKGKKSPHVNLGPLRDRCTPDQLFRNPPAYLDHENLSLAVVVDEEESDVAEDVAGVVDLVLDTGNILVVFGEVRSYVKHHKAAEMLVRIATRGRHAGCPVVFESQRMVHIPPDARSQATQIESFLQTHPADLAALDEACGAGFSEKVKTLGVGESVFWRDTLKPKGPSCPPAPKPS